MSPNELWTCPHKGAARAQAPGCQRSSSGSVRRGRGGIGIASDVVKVKCAESGHPRSPDSEIDTWTVISPILGQQKQSNIHTPGPRFPQYRVNKTKQHTNNSQRSLNSSISWSSSSQMRPTRVSLLRVFFFSSFFSSKRTSVTLLKLWEEEDYTDLGTPCPRNLTIT